MERDPPYTPRPLTRDIRAARIRRLVRQRDAGTLIEMFEPMCRHIAGLYFAQGGQYADLLQEARFGVLKAVADFRPEMGASFVSFAELCARRQVVTAMIAAKRGKHRVLNEATSLDSPVLASDEESGTLADLLAAATADPVHVLGVREDIEAVLSTVAIASDIERDAFVGIHLRGLGYEELAGALGVSTKAIDNALQRTLRKLRTGRLEAA